MGLFDKVKNMFTEEVEDDDVKVEQIKKDVTHVSIESPVAKAKTEEENNYDEEVIQNFGFNNNESEEKINKPVFFDDNDFKDLNTYSEPKKYYGMEETQKKDKIEEPKVFKPTPIISPVYGILDKNYHKEDIVSRRENSDELSDVEPSIDSIRNKAYGTLEDELENTLFGSNSILFKHEKIEEIDNGTDDSSIDSLTDDISKELDELLIKKEKYYDKEDYKNDEDDLLEFIDNTLYEEGENE